MGDLMRAAALCVLLGMAACSGENTEDKGEETEASVPAPSDVLSGNVADGGEAEPAADPDAVAAAQADAARKTSIGEAMAGNGIPGLAVAIVEDGTVRTESYGTARPGANVPVTAQTRFEAASLSKTVVAAIAMELAMSGELQLDAPLAETEAAQRISDRETYGQLTPRMILSHQSGLPNWAGNPMDPDRDDPLEFGAAPGERFGYSGEAFELLRAHLESVTGNSLEVLFEKRKTKFGMLNSTFVYTGAEPAATAIEDADIRQIPQMDRANAAASLVTTAEDYGNFLNYLVSTDQTRQMLAAMLTPLVTVTGDEWGGDPEAIAPNRIAWGHGWGILDRRPGGRAGFHWGDNGHFKAFVAVNPARRAAVVYFANGTHGLRLVEPVVEPIVGDMAPVRAWLQYESG